jgi:hypothetical protein
LAGFPGNAQAEDATAYDNHVVRIGGVVAAQVSRFLLSGNLAVGRQR